MSTPAPTVTPVPGTGDPGREHPGTSDATRRRREFVRTHHPDVGGDPAVFVAGLAALEAEDRAAATRTPARPRVYVVHRPGLAQRVRRRLARDPRPSRVL